MCSIPSLLATIQGKEAWVQAGLTLGLLQISRSMYICLTVWTGAVPAEYFSVKKRPAYKEYQATTNMFFPWFPKPESQAFCPSVSQLSIQPYHNNTSASTLSHLSR